MQLQLVTNLGNVEDIQAAIAFLSKHLDGTTPPAPSVPPSSVIEDALEDLRSRLGHSLSSMVHKTLDFTDWVDLRTFATHLGRPYASVRASFNSPLKRALNTMKRAYPTAPDLLEWRRADNGRHWEFRLTVEWRMALTARPLVFEMIPKP